MYSRARERAAELFADIIDGCAARRDNLRDFSIAVITAVLLLGGESAVGRFSSIGLEERLMLRATVELAAKRGGDRPAAIWQDIQDEVGVTCRGDIRRFELDHALRVVFRRM